MGVALLVLAAETSPLRLDAGASFLASDMLKACCALPSLDRGGGRERGVLHGRPRLAVRLRGGAEHQDRPQHGADEHVNDDMDINAAVIVDGTAMVAEVGEQIFRMILAVTSGEETKSESMAHGEEAFVPWHIGRVLKSADAVGGATDAGQFRRARDRHVWCVG